MLEAAFRGDIDVILTKSVSRFARNTVILLETVRDLKAAGIAVRFERENIDTLSADGELMLSILASFAQEEAWSTSANMKWGTLASLLWAGGVGAAANLLIGLLGKI